MIIIKTKMRRMPKSCNKCPYYRSAMQNYICVPTCRAKNGWEEGKSLEYVSTSVGRASWCPLTETEAIK